MINVKNVRVKTTNCNLWIEKSATISLSVTRNITPEENERMITSAIDYDEVLKQELHKRIYGDLQYEINHLHHIVMSRVNVEDIHMYDKIFENIVDMINYKG